MITRKVNEGALQLVKDEGSSSKAIRPTTNKYKATSTAAQSQINLDFAVEIANKDNFLLFIDGVSLDEGASGDFEFTEISNGQSSKILLNSPLVAGLSIQAIYLGVFNSVLNASSLQANINDKADRGVFIKDLVEAVYVDVPHTEIENRSQMVDPENDLGARFGVDRIEIDEIYKSKNEFGPNGESVFKMANDSLDRFRFVGEWYLLSDSYGSRANSSSEDDFVEISFFGTGLNYLGITSDVGTVVASVDGGTEGSNIAPNGSAVISNRNYNPNNVITIVSGLSEGIHTVKLRKTNASGLSFAGFEIINESTQIKVNPGIGYAKGLKSELASQASFDYASGFESGVLGTKGGRVAVYLKEDGTIGKSLTPTDATAQYLASTDHSNEEESRRYNFREFGANRADDFSTLAGGTSDRAFTLDDGTTTLVGNDVAVVDNNIIINTNSSGFLTITFVGTGLDISWGLPAAGGTNSNADAFEVFIDGVSQGNWDTVGATSLTTKKICSGLPYGTHTVKILRNVPDVWSLTVRDFIVYQPKTPALPDNASLISSYNIMADYVANTTTSKEALGVGTLRKSPMREQIYVDGGTGSTAWSLGGGLDVTRFPLGWEVVTNKQNAYFEYSFYGTGFEMRTNVSNNRSDNIQITLNGLNANLTNFPTLVDSVYGTGMAFNNTTGILDTLDASSVDNSGLSISELPLGFYTVKFENLDASEFLILSALDIITPIYSPESSLPYDLQSSLSVGSNNLGDKRVFDFDITERPNIAVAKNISGGTTTSTIPVPIPELQTSFYMEEDGFAEVNMKISLTDNQVNGNTWTYLFVDGKEVDRCEGISTAFNRLPMNNTALIPLSKGFHFISGKMSNDQGYTNSVIGNTGVLTVKEIK